MTKQQRQAYYDLGTELQNHPANTSQDHMTIMGMMENHTEFMRHLSRLSAKISDDKNTEVIEACIEIQLM